MVHLADLEQITVVPVIMKGRELRLAIVTGNVYARRNMCARFLGIRRPMLASTRIDFTWV